MAGAVGALLTVNPGSTIVDATLGHSGHAKLLAAGLGPEGLLIGLDRDPAMAAIGEAQLRARFPEGSGPRIVVRAVSYENIVAVLDEVAGGRRADVILADFGVNSRHLDEAERGFSFSKDGPLDMRFNAAEGGPSAADFVNGASEFELTRVLRDLGEERLARQIAKRIVSRRAERRFETTKDLADTIWHAYPPKSRYEGIHPATRAFMAIRLAVNDELGAVERGTREFLKAVAPGGRICCITFHSLEDRIVKQVFREATAPRPDPGNPYSATTTVGIDFEAVTPRAVACTEEEARENPRARSAKLRVVERKGVGQP